MTQLLLLFKCIIIIFSAQGTHWNAIAILILYAGWFDL